MKVLRNYKIVIPAKAEIQYFNEFWMPAFAGMTDVGVTSDFFNIL
jgi:hypothetical protein